MSAEAVSALEGELSSERTRALLDRALSQRQILAARVCMEAIGRGGGPAAVDTLAEVMEEADIELVAAAAEALGATGSPAAEAPLIAALRREQTAIQAAAANALGRVGSVAAVLPLKEAGENVWLDPSSAEPCARRSPRSNPGPRAPRPEAGQLSLAEDPAGRLSLPPGERPA